MSLHADLLAQAEHLAQIDARRPKQASLRRSVSTAYYALFHLLTHHAARQIVPGRGFQLLRQTVHRAFKHADMKTVAKQFARGETDSRWNAAIGADPLSDDLKKVAEAFVLLQQAHHSADYDVSRSFTRDEALTNVGITQEAFASFERTRRTGAARVFLTALLLQRSVMS